VVLASIVGAVLAVFGAVVIAGAILLLISDWGSERANGRVRTVRWLVVGACLASVVVLGIEIAEHGFPMY
jgi:hypothetical protein